jgi:molybdopterin-binding protein
MALPELLANIPSGSSIATLGEALSAGGTTLNASAAAPAPLQTAGQFRIVVDSEIMLVTAGASGTTWTVTRNVEPMVGGSGSVEHSLGAQVYFLLTAAGLAAKFPARNAAGMIAVNELVALGEVAGVVKLDLAEGNVFAATLKGATEFEVVNASLRPSPLVLYVTQNATGGYAWSVKGISWVGSEPVFATTAEISYVLNLESLEGAAKLYASAGLEGPKGATGAEGAKGTTGATGATGAKGEAGTSSSAMVPVLMPILAGGAPVPIGAESSGTVNRAFFMRAIVPKTGKLKDISIWNGGEAEGELRVAIFDTGDAAEGKYTLLKQSAAKKQEGTNAWQTMGSLEELELTAGKQILLAVMSSSTKSQIGRLLVPVNVGSTTLPEGYLPVTGKAKSKMGGAHTFGSLEFATITEAQLETGSEKRQFLIIGRIE